MRMSGKAVVVVAVVVFLSLLAPAATQAQHLEGDGSAAIDKGSVLKPRPAPKVGQLTVSKTISAAEQAEALAYWTEERVASAQPMDISSIDVGINEADAAPQALGPPGSTGAGLADANADALAEQAFPAEWAEADDVLEAAATAAEITPAGTAGVYSSYDVNRVKVVQKLYPHRWAGRLTFRTPAGNSQCSATAISGNNIVTAAHCVYDTQANRFYSNWVFKPAFRNGNAPFGTYSATACTVLTAWVNLSGGYSINGHARHDVAVCSMGRSAGKTLNQRVGWAGRQWNHAYNKHVHNMGYPVRNFNNQNIAQGGKYLRTCIAETFRQTTDTRGMGCNWGGGISGGPWLVGYQLGKVNGQVTGVNSGIFIGSQNIYGARFTSNNIVPLCNARNC